MNLRFIELDDPLTPCDALYTYRDFSGLALLESAQYERQRGRYSYFSTDPAQTWLLEKVNYGDDPFQEIKTILGSINRPLQPELPPFQGGIIGLLGYELGHCWEQLPEVPCDSFYTPALSAGLYDWLICWDHLQKKRWLLVHENIPGFENRPTLKQRLEQLQQLKHEVKKEEKSDDKKQILRDSSTARNTDSSSLLGNFTQEEYLDAVAKVIQYIQQGDIYQANLSRKLEYEFLATSIQLYDAIRKENPAPFAAYFQPSNQWAMISASPEQFLQVKNRQVTTRPIKGTRPRWEASDTDLLQGIALRNAEKDRAENTMIVDLMRNDLSRVCKLGSVKVPQWCELESFKKVHHLVSEVTGELNDHADIWDLLAATFPGGSITGAPKIRAMEIISELEQTARGHYCGSLIAAGFDGSLQSNILIRTLIHKNGRVQCPVGGGIVADSLPENEFTETEHKAAGLIVSTKK